MLKNFATSSRLVRDTRKFSRHSHECRAKVRDKIRKTVARNSHASEILALGKPAYCLYYKNIGYTFIQMRVPIIYEPEDQWSYKRSPEICDLRMFAANEKVFKLFF